MIFYTQGVGIGYKAYFYCGGCVINGIQKGHSKKSYNFFIKYHKCY